MRTIVLVALSFLLSIGMMAQKQKHKEKPDPAERAARQTEKMTESLNLSEEQKAEVHRLNEMMNAELHQLREEGKAERDARKKEADILRKEYAKSLELLLDKEQFVKWQATQKERMHKKKEKRQERPIPEKTD